MQGLGLGLRLLSLPIALAATALPASPSSLAASDAGFWTGKPRVKGSFSSDRSRKPWSGTARVLSLDGGNEGEDAEEPQQAREQDGGAEGSEEEGGEEGPRSRRRLVDAIRLIPRASERYFRSPFRRALFGAISLLGGFYVAQTISLSFGALGVNDVIAAVLCVLFTEYVTQFYYSRPRPTFSVALLNNFKMGFSYGLFIDAFKLAS